MLAARSEVTTQMVEEFCGKPSSVSPLETFREIVLDYARNQPDKLRRVAKMASLEADNPTLRPYRVAQEAELVDTLRELIATRTESDADTDLYPWLAATAAVSAMMAALEVWSRADFPEGRLPALIEESFAITEAGYPTTSSAPAVPA